MKSFPLDSSELQTLLSQSKENGLKFKGEPIVFDSRVIHPIDVGDTGRTEEAHIRFRGKNALNDALMFVSLMPITVVFDHAVTFQSGAIGIWINKIKK